MFFPSSVINYNQKYFEFLAVGKCGGELGIVLELRDDVPNAIKLMRADDYDFISFTRLFYSPEEARAIEDLQQRINEYKKELKALEAVEFVTKKDGQPFADVLKNIKSDLDNGRTLRAYRGSFDYSIELSPSEIITGTNADGEKYSYSKYFAASVYWPNNEEKTLITFKKALDATIKAKREHMAEYEREIENIKKIFKSVYALKEVLSGCTYTTREAVKKAL